MTYPGGWKPALFHAQQAWEKALKAVLTSLQGDVLPVHDAGMLLRAASDLGASVPPEADRAATALHRYEEDVTQALARNDAVLAWCDAVLAKEAP